MKINIPIFIMKMLNSISQGLISPLFPMPVLILLSTCNCVQTIIYILIATLYLHMNQLNNIWLLGVYVCVGVRVEVVSK